MYSKINISAARATKATAKTNLNLLDCDASSENFTLFVVVQLRYIEQSMHLGALKKICKKASIKGTIKRFLTHVNYS